MDRKMPMFVGGLTGALIFFFLLIFRNWSTVSLLSDVTGSSKALVVVFAVAVLVAALTGALTLLAQPANFFGAMLFGFVPPALIVAIGIPRVGLPERTSDEALKDSLKTKKMLFATWLGLNPIESMSELRSDEALAGARSRIDQRVKAARTNTGQEWREKLRNELAAAKSSAEADQKAAVEVARKEGSTALLSAVQVARDESKATIARLRQNASVAEGLRDEAVAQSEQFASQVEALKRQLSGASGTSSERDALKAQVAKLKSTAADATKRAAAAEARLGDYQRLADWYNTSPPNNGARLIKMLVGKLRSRDAIDRLTSVRLMPLCGKSAMRHLERALNDSDEDVQQAAFDSIEKLEQDG